MKRYLLVHYGEIGLKKSNKKYFVEKLRKFLKHKLEQNFRFDFRLRHGLGRFMVTLPDDFVESDYVKVLSKIFGIKNFKFVYEGKTDIAAIAEQIWQEYQQRLVDFPVKFANFRVKSKRSMILPFNSVEAEREIGAFLLEKGIDLPVKLKGADLIVDIEFFNDHGYFSFKKHEGAAGLSSNSQGKLISLISAGIDSPVASYMMMKRGARVIFVHFHAYPYTDKSELEQVQDLVKILSDYQFDTKLYLVPFGQIQRSISLSSELPSKVRTVVYRRIMLKIAELISKDEGARGLISGDSFGQVASQTPENIFAIHQASTIPLFQPLIGFDKEEIIEISKKIGTFEISKLPCKDACTMFMPASPELRAEIKDLLGYEKNLPIGEWMRKVLDETEIISF